MSNLPQQMLELFQSRFGKHSDLLVRSPGRINILGEHTDYNNGFVLPAAIDKAIFIAISKNDLDVSRVYSQDFNEEVAFSMENIKPGEKPWLNYILGVVSELQNRGHILSSFDAVFAGDIPLGAGLSSSAALECGFAFALNELFDCGLSRYDIAKTSQLAEHHFAGVMCGIMDQFASVFGQDQQLIKLDCQTLEHTYHPFSTGDYKFMLFNSKVSHELTSSEYNIRRQECEKGVEILQQGNPDIRSLRDVNMFLLMKVMEELPGKVFDRCKYVIEENKRVNQLTTALGQHDFNRVGQLMYETHEGLSREYEVSCEELDILVDLVKKEKAVIGARMMGGGFGGVHDKSSQKRCC